MHDLLLAYLHPNHVASSFHRSLIDLVGFDTSEGGQYLAQWCNVKCGSGGIPEGRNQAAQTLLDDPDLEWMVFIDADMGFAPDTIEKLRAVADPDHRPVVGALCFAYREEEQDGMGGFHCVPRPTIFDYVEHEDGVSRMTGRSHYPPNTLLRCGATGAACILIHRSAIEQVHAEYGPTWFTRVTGDDGSLLGEDISFCMRLAALDVPLFVHTGIRTTHLKELWVSESTFWSTLVAPPATVETDVIVPVLNRPGNAEPFMQSLKASTGMAHVTAVSHPGDEETAEAWRKAGAQVVIQDPDRSTTFACKVNDGYQATSRPLLFIAGDDVRFRPGWLDHAQFMCHAYKAGVVGTNDTANPRVVAGEHATHMLMVREYIDEFGASWDGPGVVCHEGYRHWFVDDEIVAAARQRRMFVHASGAIVEHLHPIWGTAEHDDVYELGQSHAESDRDLWVQRSLSPAAGAVPLSTAGDDVRA